MSNRHHMNKLRKNMKKVKRNYKFQRKGKYTNNIFNFSILSYSSYVITK